MATTARPSERIDEVRSEQSTREKVTREVSEGLVDDTLCERVDQLIRSRKCKPFLSTLGARAFIEELAGRSEGLEEAIRELALEVQELGDRSRA